MALVVYLKSVDNLGGSFDRMVQVTFRGHTQQTAVVRSKNHVAYFGETFEWPIARAAEPEETIQIRFVTYNKFMRNRVAGSCTLLLQHLVVHGQLQATEPLIDTKKRPTKVSVTFEARYYSPDGRVGEWDTAEYEYSETEEDDMCRHLSVSTQNLPACLEGVQALRHNYVQHVPTDSISQVSADFDGSSDVGAGSEVFHNIYTLAQGKTSTSHLHKPRYMQVAVKVIEVQQLAGLDIDPVIRIQVGDKRKYSSIKQSTNSPYYDEYFVFEYNQTAAVLFDKMITITACHALSIPGRQVLKAGNLVAARDIGVFQCDIATVYAAPGHLFYHKWAVLLDPKDLNQGVKGYVKCDIAVLCKGDTFKVPKANKDEDSNDIEGNLLLPAGMPLERQRASYSVVIYQAEDLPTSDLGVVASMRQAVGLSPGALVDAYVRVSFVGLVGKTSVKNSYNPGWREVITFDEMFPPLCNRIKVQLCDHNPIKDDIIGTHFIDLAQIMDPGGDSEGLLPTYGPNWLYFYGGSRGYSVLGDELNDGVGEGCYYRGRLLLAVNTRILAEELATGPATVSTSRIKSAVMMSVAPKRQFVLFATIFEATLIDKKFSGKPCHFEICIGSKGEVDCTEDEEDEDDEDKAPLMGDKKTDLPYVRETKPQLLSAIGNSGYFCMPFSPTKPCLYNFSSFEDISKRLYHTNLLQSIARSLEAGLEEVAQLFRQESSQVAVHLRSVMGTFLESCGKYLRLVDGLRLGIGSGKTKLDKYRFQMCRSNVERMQTTAREVRDVTQLDMRPKFRQARELLQRINYLAKDPQQAMPDVFVWLVCGGKRVAYRRFSTSSIIHSPTPAFMGKDCGELQTVFMKRPGKSRGQADSVIQAKLNLRLWLGKLDAYRPCDRLLEGIPDGYELVTAPDHQKAPLPPTELIYTAYRSLHLHAYIFQARGLIGSDDTGLSDPFVRVIIGDMCKETQVIPETLSPTWDETLVFSDIIVYGDTDSMLKHPPTVMVEVFDYDFAGEPEFLGRVMVQPRVCLKGTRYEAPNWPSQLQWCDLQRGTEEGGQVLAAFELIEGEREHMKEIHVSSDQTLLPVPLSIRPSLSKYRIEMLFWGLREPKRIQLLSVDRPRMEIQCGGVTLKSSQIKDFHESSNFESPVTYIDLDLPDNKALWPPITIRCVDCRKFGREVLLGTHTINHIIKYFQEEDNTDWRKESYATTGCAANGRPSITVNTPSDIGRPSIADNIRPSIADNIRPSIADNKSRLSVIESSHQPSIADNSQPNVADNTSHRSMADNTSPLNVADNTSHRSNADNISHRSNADNTSHLNVADNTSHRSMADNKSHRSVADNKSRQSMADNTSHRSVADNKSRQSMADNISHRSVADNKSRHSMADNTSHRSIAANNNHASIIDNNNRPSITVGKKRVSILEQSTRPTITDQNTRPSIADPSSRPSIADQNSRPSIADQNSRPSIADPNSRPSIANQSIRPSIADQSIRLSIADPDSRPSMADPNSRPSMADPNSGPSIPGVVPEQGTEPPAPRTKQELEQIADLDWWSKFYVSRDDILKSAEGDETDDEVLDSDDLLSDTEDANVDTVVIAVDYDRLDSGQLTELKQQADQEHLEGLSKKKRKKLLKKRTKLMLKMAKGLMNKGFVGEEESTADDNDDDNDEKSFIARLKIYLTELEKVPEFGGFSFYESFRLSRGKQNEEEEDASQRTAGKFKGTLCIYRLTEETEEEIEVPMTRRMTRQMSTQMTKQMAKQMTKRMPKLRLLKNLPNNKPFKVQVLVYIICATDLYPVDLNGKADPYIILQCGRIKINDKANRHNNQLNPVFGRLFQVEAFFPMDSLLKIQVVDYDALSADDLIGETFIDLENRYYSPHRPTCGLQQKYEMFGYNMWRDALKPTEILAGLCKNIKLKPPIYRDHSCYVGDHKFQASTFLEREGGEMVPTNEHVALEALKNWQDIPGGCQLVPEHVETRSLYNSERPGVEHGKLWMWVDMFPMDKVMPNFTVDIKPRLPQAYELRCIIWNTDEVILEDTNVITGEASSDIFVRGYVKGIGEDHQNTDIHYRSLTGEGNFNWRFVFPFEYLKAEEKVVFKKKNSVFDLTETEVKCPATLTLQVWDADIVSADDYLGSVTLDLNRIPKPVKNPKNCVLAMLATGGSGPTRGTLNLFKNKRCRGWWPMYAKGKDEMELVGKVEAELHLLTEEEASRSVVGLAREDPEGLPEPNRPDTSFLWFMNPLKTLKYVIWKNFKWKLLKLLIFLLLVAFIVLFFYSAPGATVNKIFGTK